MSKYLLIFLGCLGWSIANAQSHMQSITSDYILTTLVREKLQKNECGKLLNLKPDPKINPAMIIEKARPFLSATEALQLKGPKLASALNTEADNILHQMTSTFSIYDTKRDNCLVLFGYVVGRATQARDTYRNLGGIP